MKIIAELGTCNGDLKYAIHAAVRAAQAGAWAVKVQMHQPDRLFSEHAETYGKYSRYKTQLEESPTPIPYSDWAKVKKVCDDLGVEFFASCWDEEAVAACETMGVNFYKIASADITHQPLIELIAKTGKGIILSTGAAEMLEVERALGWIAGASPDNQVNVILLACTLSYPTDLADAAVGRVAALAGTFPGIAVGYSDHTTTMHAAWIAAAMGAPILERHFTVTPGAGGDHDFAANFETLKELVSIGENVDRAMGPFPPILTPLPAELNPRVQARRSIVAKVDIPKGTRLTADLFDFKRPGDGMPPYELISIIGGKVGDHDFKQLRASIDIPAGAQIQRRWVGLVSATLTVE